MFSLEDWLFVGRKEEYSKTQFLIQQEDSWEVVAEAESSQIPSARQIELG